MDLEKEREKYLQAIDDACLARQAAEIALQEALAREITARFIRINIKRSQGVTYKQVKRDEQEMDILIRNKHFASSFLREAFRTRWRWLW